MHNTKEFELTKSGVLPYAPAVLVLDVLRRWLLILVVAVVAGVAVYIATDTLYTPEYETSATLVVTTRDSTATVYTNLRSTTEIATVFSELLNSSVLQKVVMEEVGLPNAAYTVTSEVIEDTNLLTLKVRAPDPGTAFLVIRSLIGNHEIVTYEVIGDVIIETLQLPQVPAHPVNGNNPMNMMILAAMAAVVFACGAVLVFSHSRDAVRSSKEAEKKLPCWCLGEVCHESKHKTPADWFARRKKGLVITNPDSSFRFMETMRKLRRRVEQYMEDGQILMVTSVAENEGKSTIAVNLALSFAKKHAKVLLIDLDLRKPACHKILDMKPGSNTTTDLLNGRADIETAVLREPMSGLELILERGGGKITTEQILPMLTSGIFEKVLRQAREEYDYIVLDLPPMAAAPDTEYIMDYADASLLVIRQNQVCAKPLNNAVEALRKGKAKLLGCVLNNVYSAGISLESGSGYGYGYGKYGAYGKYGSSAAYAAGNTEE